jgi:predicted Zn-dependent protease
VAGATVAIVVLVSGIVVRRSLQGAQSATLDAAPSSPGRAPSPAWQIAPPPLPAVPRPGDRAAYEAGRRLLAAGEARAALGPLTEAARRLPGDPAVLRDYGHALIGAGQEDLGLFQLEHASRLAPGIGAYRLDFVRALLSAGRRGPAARELGELLARDPGDVVAAQLLASLDQEGGAAPAMDLGGTGAPALREGTVPFTNDDLKRQRPAVTPSVAPAAPPASPAPPA